MRQTLYDYLLERPSGAAPRELLDLIFTQPGADPEFGPRFLRALLEPDQRFVWRPNDGVWTLGLHEALMRPLRETSFVIVDLETTGLARSAQGIIEIGAAHVRDGRVVAEFQQLVNPGVRLPRFITYLTGIDDAMLADQPGIGEVWPRFLEFLGDAVLVAHNAAFDVGFLNEASVAFSGRPLSQPHLCTIKLTRRLIPEVRRRGLDALAAHFGIPQADRHRALGDVRITVEVFFHLLERLAARGVARLDQALDLQHQARDGRRFVCLLPRHTVEQLPAQPGIYRFFDVDGRLLYIGKAKNLRERVSSYLSNARDHSNKTLDLIRHSRDVRVELAASELEAALDEAAAIRREQPPYNRLGKHLPRIAFLKLSTADAYPRLMITKTLGSHRRARYVGPFRSRDEAERALGLLTRLFRVRTCAGALRPDPTFTPCFQGQIDACTAPCAARLPVEAYRQQVERCVAFLDGDTESAERDLTIRRDEHATALRFEAAANTQRDLQLLHRLARRQRTLGWIAAREHFLVLQPTPDRRMVLAYAVLNGRLAMRARLSDASEIDTLATQIHARLRLGHAAPRPRDDVDGTTILAAWLRDRGEAAGCVLRIDAIAGLAAEWPATQLSEWRATCETLLTPVAGVRPDGDTLQRTPSAEP